MGIYLVEEDESLIVFFLKIRQSDELMERVRLKSTQRAGSKIT